MTATPQPESPPTPHRSRWRDPDMLRTVATVLIGAAAGWYLMLQLAPVLRPLMLAAFLGYVLMPYHSRLRHHVGTPASLAILTGSTAGVLVALAFLSYASILALGDDLPRLQERAGELVTQAEQALKQHAPGVLPADGKPTQDRVNEQLGQVARPVLKVAADAALEACVVALYLLFLLLEGSRLPDRIRKAYTPERAEELLQIAGQINAAVISYLKAKVKSSLVLAVPVGIVLWAVGVKFALLWAILTFLCNFVPYIGTVVAYSLPVGFAFLWFGPTTWEPFAAAGLLLVCHVGSASVAEPMIIGNAVGVSPLVILGSLAFWGLLWGIAGMFLAVPLTVVTILVMDHFEQTRPIARLLKGG